MVVIENENWFSCVEIAKGINNDEPEFKELKKLYCKVFGWGKSHYFDYQYVQNHLYKATKNREIRHCVYHSENVGRPKNIYTIKDFSDWIKKQERKMITKYEIIGVAE